MSYAHAIALVILFLAALFSVLVFLYYVVGIIVMLFIVLWCDFLSSNIKKLITTQKQFTDATPQTIQEEISFEISTEVKKFDKLTAILHKYRDSDLFSRYVKSLRKNLPGFGSYFN